MPGVDFEHESRIGESIARPRNVPSGRFAGLLLIAFAMLALGYAYYVSTRGPRNAPKSDNEAFNTARAGVALAFAEPEPAKSDNRLQLPPVPPPTPAPVVASASPPPLPIVADDDEARRRAEEERLRREAEARENARLRSAMLVLDLANNSSAFGAANGSADPVKVQGPEEDPNRRFLANAQDVDTAHAHRIARIDALVPQGTMIRATLETAIQSDLPGMVKAITREDVYSFDGRRVLIPSGTMLTGEYRSALTRGQTRVFVIWTRLLRADGISLSLGSYGTDSLGRSGLSGDVDEHYFQRFGSSILLSIVGGGSAFLAGLNSTGQSVTASGNGTSVGLQAQTQAQQTASQTFSDLANRALKDSIDIPPTINVDQGARIVVFVKRDLDFSEYYPDPVRQALYELRHPRPKAPSRDAVGSVADFSPTVLRADPTLVGKP